MWHFSPPALNSPRCDSHCNQYNACAARTSPAPASPSHVLSIYFIFQKSYRQIHGEKKRLTCEHKGEIRCEHCQCITYDKISIKAVLYLCVMFYLNLLYLMFYQQKQKHNYIPQ